MRQRPRRETIYEQTVQATDPETGATLLLRRIEIRLFEKTRDGERVIGLLTNLPDTVSAMVIAEIYRKRWTIETQFQLLTVSLHCEVPGLGKPKAALFAFAMSLVASNAAGGGARVASSGPREGSRGGSVRVLSRGRDLGRVSDVGEVHSSRDVGRMAGIGGGGNGQLAH